MTKKAFSGSSVLDRPIKDSSVFARMVQYARDASPAHDDGEERAEVWEHETQSAARNGRKRSLPCTELPMKTRERLLEAFLHDNVKTIQRIQGETRCGPIEALPLAESLRDDLDIHWNKLSEARRNSINRLINPVFHRATARGQLGIETEISDFQSASGD